MSEIILPKRNIIRKAQPTSTSVHVNAPLTNISIAYIQSANNFVADKVFPVVPVDKQTDIYYLYTKNDWFRDEAQLRAPATESAGGGYNLDSTNTYACKVYAFHKDIPDQIRANADSMLDMERDATLFVTQRLLLKREITFASNYMAVSKGWKDYTGVASGPSTDQFVRWDDYQNSDPIADIKAARIYIQSITGFEPNTLVLSVDTFETLKNHPDIVDRFKYTQAGIITADIIARLFEVERILISGAVKATNVEGETSAYSFVNSKCALLCYSAPNPGLLTPSAGYTFSWKGLSGLGYSTAIKNFRMEHLESDRVEGQSAFDCKLVAGDLGAFFYTAIS